MLPLLQHRWTSLCLLVMSLGALMLFLYGFFPLKYHSGKLAHLDDLPDYIDNISIDGHEVYNPGENTVILMVIDGLRYDFVTEEYMPHTGKLLKNKSACIYTTIAEPPTVTMPRIKAMMTGTVSTFADVALNFGAPEVRGDSVLRSVASRGKRSVMYGDDTWLRLFPGLWAEADGTTSFYVTDYTEVDMNVTRHLPTILKPDDKTKPTFDFLVLHYLGLDHIGHLEGARSAKIKPKLEEMDIIVQMIITSMKIWDRPSVLFICGDHGMRDAGGHGGATPAEVLVPLVVIKSEEFECPHPLGATVSQVDLAPSISWLLNSPIPAESTGRILSALLPPDMISHLYLLHVVATHNSRLPTLPTDKEFYKTYKRAERQFAHYLATKQESAAKISKHFYEDALAGMAEYLEESTEQFDLFAITTAIFVLYLIVKALLFIVVYSLQQDILLKQTHTESHRRKIGSIVAFGIILTICLAIQVLTCFITETKSQLCSFEAAWLAAFLTIGCTITTLYFIIKAGIQMTRYASPFKDLNAIDYLLIVGTLFHAWSFFGTSFIEEEHMTWYFFWNTLMFFVLARTVVILVVYVSKKRSGATEVQDKPHLLNNMVASLNIVPKWVLLIALHRYLRTINQTGDRWLHLPDTADWLNAPENSRYLFLHVMIGTLLTLYICMQNLQHMNNIFYIHSGFTIAMTACIICYRIQAADPVTIVDIFWKILAAHIAFEILTYIGFSKTCQMRKPNAIPNKFDYKKPKEKTDDLFYDSLVEEPWNLNAVKLKMAKSLSYIMVNSLLLIITLLVRPHNVVMVPSVYITCVLTSKCLDHKLLDSKPGRNTDAMDVFSQTLVHLWIGSLFFFYQGNSNSLASVDLGAGYVGLTEYCAWRVALRMGLHAYAGPALAGATMFATIAHKAQDFEQYLEAIWRATNIYAFHRVYVVVVYCVVATFFRDHLYVWTVFSPKLLYDFVATVFTVQALCTVAVIILTTHVTSRLAKMVAYR